jgi:leucyl aminopeptidase
MKLPVAGRRDVAVRPVYSVPGSGSGKWKLPKRFADWARKCGFSGERDSLLLVPDEDGGLAGAIFGRGEGKTAMGAGTLARRLPAGDWSLEGETGDPFLASLGFLLGAYRYDRYRKKQKADGPRLALAAGVERAQLAAIAESVWLARDLINAPANDLGPAELEAEIRKLAREFGARVQAIRGDDLLKRNFPMVHAVGRASSRAPRIVSLTWGRSDHRKVTLVGKGVCFDSGGLDIKSADNMLMMKKDMGGAANAMALARMIMAAQLPVRLRMIVAAVENAISGNAYRPGDVLKSRKGLAVEIGNTDAEGRLILADALAWADEEAPDLLIDMATLTGAARVALGPDLPAMFCNDDYFAAEVEGAGLRIEDPVWRLPLWPGYRPLLSSKVADISHIGKGPMAGAVLAALFLGRFVEKANIWAHFDMFAWSASEKPWCPVGGEAQAIRALFEVLKAGRSA